MLYSLDSVTCRVKAAERVEGGIHRGKPGSFGQSEETTTADRPAKVTADHQDAGKVNTHRLRTTYFILNCD